MHSIEVLFRAWREDGVAIRRAEYAQYIAIEALGVPVEDFDEEGRAATAAMSQVSSDKYLAEDGDELFPPRCSAR